MKLSIVLIALTSLGIVGAVTGTQGRQQADLLITGGTVITMDSARRVIDDGAVAITGNRIVAVGTTREVTAAYSARETIDARRKIVMPGLIDGHGHAGH